MEDNLVVSVLGNRNSGKSYTWNKLFGREVRTGKKLKRLYFNENEYVLVFLISGSPEERHKYVGDLITAKQPEIVLCSRIMSFAVTQEPSLPVRLTSVIFGIVLGFLPISTVNGTTQHIPKIRRATTQYGVWYPMRRAR